MGLVLLVGPQPDNVVGEFALRNLAVWGDEESIRINARIDRQTRDEADVCAFRSLDRTDASVVRNVHVANFEASPLAIESARAERREPTLVRQHRERIGLIDNLRELTAAEKVFDGSGDAFGVDQRPRRHFRDVLEAHPLLHRATELEKALPKFIAGKFVDRPQPAVAEMVDIVHLNLSFPLAELEHVFDRGNQIVWPQRHLCFGHRKTQLAVHAKAADPAETVAICVFEFLIKQRARLVESGGVARPQPLVDTHQGVLVAGSHASSLFRLVRIFFEAVHDERNLLLLHHLHRREPRRGNKLGLIVADFAAGVDNDLTGPLRSLGINDVVDGDSRLDLRHASGSGYLLNGRLIKELQNLAIPAIFRVNRPQQREG